MCVPGEARSRPRLQSRLPSRCCGALGLRVLCGCSPRSRCPLPRLPCSQLLLTCFALSLRLSASLTACGGEYVNGQRPITANGDYRLQYSHWTLTHQPFTDLDCHRLQVGHPHLVLDTYALHVRPPQQVDVRSQGSIGRAPLYPVGVRGARYHGQGSWAGECGSPGSLGKRGARELERASSQSHSARNCDIHPVPCRYPVDRQPHSHRFCASTGDRKSSHQAAPIVCSQFALLSPDSATSHQ